MGSGASRYTVFTSDAVSTSNLGVKAKIAGGVGRLILICSPCVGCECWSCTSTQPNQHSGSSNNNANSVLNHCAAPRLRFFETSMRHLVIPPPSSGATEATAITTFETDIFLSRELQSELSTALTSTWGIFVVEREQRTYKAMLIGYSNPWVLFGADICIWNQSRSESSRLLAFF